MRVLIALVAAVGLAGCQVELEGAACAVPGANEQCPSGQRCGNDLRCSARAAACVNRCKGGERGCVEGDVRICEDTDPVCGTWKIDVDCAAGLECSGSGAAAACFCPQGDGISLYVDPLAGAPEGQPAPTGARDPASCRYRALADALTVAARGGGAVVVAAGEVPATYPVSSDLVVPPGVTLRGDDDPPAPERRVLSLEGELAAGVTLADGAALSGFTIRNDSASASAAGVKVACAAGAAARLEDVMIEAAGATTRLEHGVRADGACPLELAHVTVSGASGPGLLVARDASDQTVVVADSTFDGNGEGVRLTRGDLTLERALVEGNAGVGVVAGGTGGRLTLDGCTVRRNGDTGVTVSTGLGGLRLLRSRICGNAAASDRGAPYATRRVGGLYLYGNAPVELALLGNAVHGNGGDQLLVASSSTWRLDGSPAGASACSADANVFANYAPGYVGVYAATARVSALWNAWRGIETPSLGTDYAVSAPGTVEAGELEPARFCLVTDVLTCD